jgi:HEAT repeat protein
MNRIALLLVLLGGTAFGHGGVFRPPPVGGPGDPTKPGGRPGTTTAPGTKAGAFTSWESWWFMNREPYLRLRERIRERIVITGRSETEKKKDPFDRRGLRDGMLLPVMLEALKDPEEAVRGTAAVALGKFQATDAEPLLFELMRKEKSRQVREAAMLGLMLMRDASLRAALRDIALDSKQERRLRGFAILGLGFLNDSPFLLNAVGGKGKRLRGTRPTVEDLQACAALAAGFTDAPAAVPLLSSVAVNKHAPDGVRGFAGSALGRIGNPLALSEMLSLIRDREAKNVARYGAAIAVGGLVKPEEKGIIDFLGKKAQRDRDAALRSLLVMSLGRIGGENAAAHLVGGMRSCDQEMRGFYYIALGISNSDDAGPILLETLGRLKNSKDRAACALGLALCGHKAAAPDLRDLVADGHPAFVPHGMVALGILDDAKAIPIVQKLLKAERDPMIRREGAIALALLRRTAAIPELVTLLQACKTRLSRASVAWALGFIGTDRAIEPLLAIYRDKRRPGEERAIALAALGKIGDLSDIPLLAEFAFDLNPYVASQAVSEALTIL